MTEHFIAVGAVQGLPTYSESQAVEGTTVLFALCAVAVITAAADWWRHR